MKKLILLCLVSIFLADISHCQINLQRANEIIAQHIEDNISDNHLLYFYDDTLSLQISIITWWDTLIAENSYVYFIDEIPNANWTHPCQYIFIDKSDGEIEIIQASTPPLNPEFSLKTPITPLEEDQERERVSNRILSKNFVANVGSANERYAVILSGGGSPTSNYERYWNDCSFIYKVLVYAYGYSPNNIYVLISDGTDPGADRRITSTTYDSSPLDLDGNGTDDIQYSATKDNISKVFDILAKRVTQADDLFVFTTDHGDRSNGVSSLVLWNNIRMYPSEFAAELNKVKANTCVVMEQCYSGGFVSSLERDDRVIMTACKSDEVSYASSSGTYNEFVYHWTSAMQKAYPSGVIVNADNNGNGIISMKEAFEYAKANDTKNETPQYSSKNESLGNEISLWGTCETINVLNQTITDSQKVEGCSIKVQNTTVTGNAALTLEALEEVTIQGGFEVSNGATLDIKITK